MPYNKNKKSDTYELITKKLISLIQQGTIPWRKPYSNPKIEEAESFVKAQNAVIKTSLEGAAYYPQSDFIGMPHLDTFRSSESYYSVLLHELAHWTGHESRLNRKSSTNKNSSS